MLSDFLDLFDESLFEEKPVDLETFLYEKEFMGLPPLSPIQEEIVARGSQIYKIDALTELHGEKEAEKIWKRTTRDLLLTLGKGCSAPYSEIYNAENGKWDRLDSLKDSFDGHVVGLTGNAEYRTESFYEGTGEMLRVTTELGFVEDVYIGHKYWGMKKSCFYKRKDRGYEPEDILAKDLVSGDRIAVGLNMPVLNEISIGEDVAWILGVWLGDGCMPQSYENSHSEGTLSVDFGGTEKESLENYLFIVRSWGDNPSVKRHANKDMVTVYHNRTNSPAVFKLAEEHEMTGKSAKTKTIPDVVWSLPKNELYMFIGGMWQTDGSIYFKKCKGETQSIWISEWCSISKEMAYGFQKLLLRAGIPSSIRSKFPKYTYKGKKKTGQQAFILTISGQDKLTPFNDNVILFDHKREKQFLAIERANNVNKAYSRLDGNIYYDRVKSIDSIGESDYWTMTNPETHHYIGNGMISAQSGKDFVSQLICAYAVHKLLCLKDPAQYFGKPSGDAIDIVNMAINAQQAKRVFFDGLVNRIKRSPWFQGRYNARMNDVAFDKNVTIYSLHSGYEAAEGLNIMISVLDEIDGFEVEGQADAIYKALSGTVSSRFSDVGKVIRLSFPRKKDGHMMTAYNDAVIDKEVREFSYTFKLNDDLLDGIEENEFTVTWEEEEILGYKYDNFFAIKAPTFRVNPIKSINDYKMDFYSDEEDTLMRVCANPPDSASNAFFKNHEKLKEAFSETNGWDEKSQEVRATQIDEKAYYIHIDLSKVHDRTVVALGHVEDWKHINIAGTLVTDPAPFIRIDLFRVWEPTKSNSVDHGEVMQFIIDLCKKFRVEVVTFDQWGSANMIEHLTAIGIRAEKKSLARPEYQEFAVVVGERRIKGPKDDRLMDELTHLVILPDGKVDHPKKNHNDISEAICGVVRNCVENEAADSSIAITTLDTLRRNSSLQSERESDTLQQSAEHPIPNDIADWIKNIRGI